MMRGLVGIVLAASLVAGLAALAGCGRHVVLDPEEVELVNQRMWLVKSEPRPADPSATDAGRPP